MLNQFKDITCFVFDVDGVLTDGSVLLLDDGQMARSMNIKDGYALQLAVKKGYHVAVISGAGSASVKMRLEKLGVKDVFQQVENKLTQLETYLRQHDIRWQQVLFMGDDIPDYTVMKKAGLSSCPADAVPEIKQISNYISPFNGGKGCVRDVIEKVLKLNEDWSVDPEIRSR